MSIEWVPIRGYEGIYEISEYGDIRFLERKHLRKKFIGDFLKPSISRKGYAIVRLTDENGIRRGTGLHRLVLSSFDVMREDMQVNHKDFDKLNNHISNLEWVTNTENCAHKMLAGRQAKGEMTRVNKLKEEDVEFIRKNYKSRCTQFGSRALGRLYGVDHMTILSCVNRKSWKHVD